MSRVLAAVDRYWMPATSPMRLAILRILVGGYGLVYMLIRLPHQLSYADVDPFWFRPVGVVSMLPAPLLPPVVVVLAIGCVITSACFVLGYRHRIVAPAHAALLLWVLSYSFSFGKILHTDNLFWLHVAVLAIAPASDVLSLDARRRRRSGDTSGDTSFAEPNGKYGWPIRLMGALAVATYFLAAIAKAKNSGLGLVEGETLRNYVAFDNVRKVALGDIHSPLGAALLPYGGVFTSLAWVSLVIEFGAPLALVHRRVGQAWSVVVWGFHLGVLALMAIGFVYPISFIAFAAFFPVERLLELRPLRRFAGQLRAPK